MKAPPQSRITTWANLVLALITLAIAPVAAQAGRQVPFRLAWTADIAISPLTPPWVEVTGLGAGQATHLGAVTAQSISETVNLETGDGIATYRFVAANRDEVHVDFAFTAIPTSPGVYTIQGAWQVVGGTGRFAGASGDGTYTGQVEFAGPLTAVGQFEAEGTISSPGSLR